MKTNFFKNMIKIDNITNSEKVLLAITLLVLLIIITSVLYSLNNDDDKEIDYSEFIIEDVVANSIIITDRQKYFDLYEIISNYLYSYDLEIDALFSRIDYSKIKYTREEYYLVLTEEYKKQLKKNEYMTLSKEFFEKFLKLDKYGQYIEVNSDIIKNIYLLPNDKYGKNMYICELNTTKKNELAYIGIYLNQNQKKYNIFYIL